MNQYLTENHYRRFPFQQDTEMAFADDAVVDASVVLSTAFAATGVRLALIEAGVGSTKLWFAIDSTTLPDYQLLAEVPDDTDEDTRILLSLLASDLEPHPELGYGYLVIGSTASLAGWGAPVEPDSELDRNVIRAMRTNQALTIRVANKTRPGPSSCAETAGAESVTSLLGRVATEVAGCVELTTSPDIDQVSADEDGNTAEVPIVPPEVTLTRYADGVVTEITTTLATITDAIPELPDGYDAIVDTGAVEVSPVVAAGHNVDLSGNLSDGQLTIGYRLGGGDGIDCTGVKGYDDLGRLAKDCVKSVNGAHTLDGKLALASSGDLSLLSDPLGHRIIVLVNSQDLKRVDPA